MPFLPITTIRQQHSASEEAEDRVRGPEGELPIRWGEVQSQSVSEYTGEPAIETRSKAHTYRANSNWTTRQFSPSLSWTIAATLIPLFATTSP